MSHTHTNNNSIGQLISISVTQSVHLPYTQHTCNNMLLIWWPEGKLWSEQGGCWLAKANICEKFPCKF